MIFHLRVRSTDRSLSHVVIECGGVGYVVHVSLNTTSRLSSDEAGMILIHEVIREDAHELYGFADEGERQMFRKLISVSGVGANTARMILSSLSASELVAAILSGDVSALQNVKGIGAKTAQRIIVDLHDKFSGDSDITEKIYVGGNTAIGEALSALSSLGFDKTKAQKTLDSIVKTEGTDISVEDLIKKALKQL
ncbi:MAG: Holliday junction branch migration protein RuvA [Flavobacteriales bacterium]|nr:Holliday junction branch migration protein RuvA [Flavobacteriales bacterium]